MSLEHFPEFILETISGTTYEVVRSLNNPHLASQTMQRNFRNYGDIPDDFGASWKDQYLGTDGHSGVGPVADVYAGNSENTHEWLNYLPRGTPLPPGVSALDAISETVASIRPALMIELLVSMKTFILEQPDRAHALLTAHPQLAYALFQALLVHDPAVFHCMNSALGHGAAEGR